MKTGTMPETVAIDTGETVQETEELAEKGKVDAAVSTDTWCYTWYERVHIATQIIKI